tara:strand:- start:350 stop:526 length:177 start_codon:yes stop_codon:yes gene_type:complete
MPKEEEIFGYKIVDGYSLVDLSIAVSENIDNGWQPIGGLSFGKDDSLSVWAQAMVMYR